MTADIQAILPKLQPNWEVRETMECQMPQYLFYESIPGRRQAKLCKCTACGGHGVFEIEGAKHKAKLMCPMCLEPVTLIAHGKLRDDAPSLEEKTPVVWFKAFQGDLWAVNATAYRQFHRNSWDGPDWSSSLGFDIYSVYCFRPGEACEWRNSMWFGWQREASEPKEPRIGGQRFWRYWGTDAYTVWQTEEVSSSSMRYCAIEDYFELLPPTGRYGGLFMDGERIYGAIQYLTAYCRRSRLELVVKWGLEDIATDFVINGRTNGRYVNWKADTPWEFLKLTRANWNAYRNSSMGSLPLARAARVHRMPVAELLALTEGLGHPKDWLENSAAIARRGVPLKRQIKYIGKQEEFSIRTWIDWLGIWKDYLDMAEAVGRDVSTDGAIMPRDLAEAHDEMVALRRLMDAEIKGAALDQKHPRYEARKRKLEKKYAYRSGELEIQVPRNAAEIIREGNVLKICVGGYAERHLSGKTTILFLRRRRKPDTPYVCIEIDQSKSQIIQIHGYRNEGYMYKKPGKRPEQKHEAFLHEWLAWVKAGSNRDQNGNPIINQEVKTA